MRTRNALLIVSLAAIVLASGPVIFSAANSANPPQRIVLTLTADPAHAEAVAWQSATAVSSPQAQISVASADPAFAKQPENVVAERTNSGAGDGAPGTYSAVFRGLKPDTLYAYRVGDGTEWSEWNTFRTASEKSGPFSFLYLGDAQNNIASMWSRVVRTAVLSSPSARFMVHAGDLVAEGYDDKLWAEWTGAIGFASATIPSLPVPGNHDLHRPKEQGKEVLSAAPPWNHVFALPANGPDIPELRGQSYYVDYQGVRFIALDVNVFANEDFAPSAKERVGKLQLAWLEGLLKKNPNRWTVVIQHQTMYSIASNRDYAEMRSALVPLYDKYGVDLVLQGHDHAYARSYKLAGGKIVDDAQPGTVYVISVSGPKMYVLTPKFLSLMAKTITDRQMYQVIDVDSSHIGLKAYSATGALLDEVAVHKLGNVAKATAR